MMNFLVVRKKERPEAQQPRGVFSFPILFISGVYSLSRVLLISFLQGEPILCIYPLYPLFSFQPFCLRTKRLFRSHLV